MTDETKELIKQVLEKNGGASQDLFEAIHLEHRHRQHAIAKAAQPAEATFASVVAVARQPHNDAERSQQGLDYLCQTVQDCIDAGDFDDVIFALVRVWRKCWALVPNLGPIERGK